MLHLTPVRHTIASASTAVFETILFVMLVHTNHISPNIWNIVTIFLGTSGNYLLNKYWVFGSSQRAWHREVGHFFIIAALALVAQSLFFSLFYALLHLAVWAKLLALTLGFLINYPMKRWVFHSN